MVLAVPSGKAQSIDAQITQLKLETDTTLNTPYKYATVVPRHWQVYNDALARLMKRQLEMVRNLKDSTVLGVGPNFATANLTATGHRLHDWASYNFKISSISLFQLTNATGDSTIGFNSATSVILLGDKNTPQRTWINGVYGLPIADGTVGQVLKTDGAGNASWGTGGGTVTSITAGTGLSGGTITGSGTISLSVPVSETKGGTGQTTYITGDIPYASAANTLSKLAIGANEYYISSNGTIPGWTQRNFPILRQVDRSVGVTNTSATLAAETVGASDASYYVSANVLVTTSTLYSFTVICSYTDEGSNARVITIPFTVLAGTTATVIANGAGTVPYEGLPMHIRCRRATTITIATTGTFTGVVYNLEERIIQE